MGNKSRGAQFFNQPTLEQALDALPDYFKSGAGGRSQVKDLRTAKKRAQSATAGARKYLNYCAETFETIVERPRRPVGAEKEPKPFIAAWGHMWALGVVWSLVSPGKVSVDALGKLVRAHMTDFATLEDANTFHSAEKDCPDQFKKELFPPIEGQPFSAAAHWMAAFKFMMGRGQSRTPCMENCRRVRHSFASFVLHSLRQGGQYEPLGPAHQLIKYLDETNHDSIKGCVWGILKHLDIAEGVRSVARSSEFIPLQNTTSYIEPSVWTYIHRKSREHDEDIEKTAINVLRSLNFYDAPADKQCRVVWVTGPPHSGKKSVIGDFLDQGRKGKKPDATKFKCRDNANTRTRDLPILCLHVRKYDYLELCIHVLVFLERLLIYGDKAPKTTHEDDVSRRMKEVDTSGQLPSLSSLLERIAELHEARPALFVFSDVQSEQHDDITKYFHGRGINRLLTTLLEGHKDSRFLLTGTSPDVESWGHEILPQPLPVPTWGRFGWYMQDAKFKAFKDLLKDEHLIHQFRSQKIDGDAIMALSVLFEQRPFDKETFLTCLEQNSTGKEEAPPRRVEDIYARLLEQWHETGLLPYVAAIAACDDGMLRSSLRSVIEELVDAKRGIKIMSLMKGLREIEVMSKYVHGLFLKHYVNASLWRSEARFDEPNINQDKNYYYTYEFDTEIARTILKIMAEDPRYQLLLQLVNRRIANLTRSRARYRQLLGTVSRSGFKGGQHHRTIQAFVALMLSLPTEDEALAKDAEDIEWRPLSQSTQVVFNVTEGRFDRETALRFAYRVLLRGEIDKHNRMSVEEDRDSLRIKLYLMMLYPPGTIRHWRDEELSVSPESIPTALKSVTLDHLACLGKNAAGNILTAIGMAASYTGRTKLLRWADAKLAELDGSRASVIDGRSRLIAARADLEMRIGAPIGRITGKGNGGLVKSGQTLPKAALALRKDIEALGFRTSALGVPAQDVAKMGSTQVEAWFRLMARCIAMSHLTSKKYDLDVELTQLLLLEEELLRSGKLTKSPLSGGRTGRLIVQLRAFGIGPSGALAVRWTEDNGTISDEAKAAAQALVHSNVGRLADAFAGAERVQCLADHVHYLLVSRTARTPPLKAAATARQMVMRGFASDYIKFDILALECLCILLAEQYENTAPEQTEARLERLINNAGMMHRIKLDRGLEFSGWVTASILKQAEHYFDDVQNRMKATSIPHSEMTSLDSLKVARAPTMLSAVKALLGSGRKPT